jgi:hypothetical protein
VLMWGLAERDRAAPPESASEEKTSASAPG